MYLSAGTTRSRNPTTKALASSLRTEKETQNRKKIQRPERNNLNERSHIVKDKLVSVSRLLLGACECGTGSSKDDSQWNKQETQEGAGWKTHQGIRRRWPQNTSVSPQAAAVPKKAAGPTESATTRTGMRIVAGSTKRGASKLMTNCWLEPAKVNKPDD